MQLKLDPDIGVLLYDKIRTDISGNDKYIRSAFIESFITTPEFTLLAYKTGDPIHVINYYGICSRGVLASTFAVLSKFGNAARLSLRNSFHRLSHWR